LHGSNVDRNRSQTFVTHSSTTSTPLRSRYASTAPKIADPFCNNGKLSHFLARFVFSDFGNFSKIQRDGPMAHPPNGGAHLAITLCQGPIAIPQIQKEKDHIMGMIQDFRDFALKGNLIDMAVGIVMGGAVAAIVKSFLDNIVMPLIASIFKVPDMAALKTELGTNAEGEATYMMWGNFVQNTIDFMILAFVIFIALKIASNMMKKAEEEAAADPSDEVKLLTEIRDALANK
jgi:large conductance mechanosensitive channel